MNDSQIHTVLKIEKYKEAAETYDLKAAINAAIICGCFTLAIITSRMYNVIDNPYIAHIVKDAGTFGGISIGVHNLKKMIENISKKAGLENIIFQMQNDDLKENDNEENNYKGRGI